MKPEDNEDDNDDDNDDHNQDNDNDSDPDDDPDPDNIKLTHTFCAYCGESYYVPE